MASLLAASRPALSFHSLRLIARTAPPSIFTRAISTLPSNPHIYCHPDPSSPTHHLLHYLPTTPPNPHLSIGRTTRLPPTPESFTPNPDFLHLLQTVIRDHAAADPDVQSQAQVYASQAGSSLGSGGVFFPQQQQQRRDRRTRANLSSSGTGGGGAGGDGAGGASSQGGAGSGGRGGWIHVSDQRNPPDYGRVAWPEDLLGSLELDALGKFVDGHGRYQEAGTYRVVTQEGVLGLSAYLREKVVQKVKELDETARRSAS